jgi:uncharacterized protein YoaH (UPF0181 family)
MIEHLHHAPYRNKELLEQKYLLERRSIKEISREWACSRSVVAKYLKDYSIPLSPHDSKNKSRVGYGEAWRDRQVVAHKKEQELIEKMKKLRAEGLSYNKIAAVLNGWGIRTKTGKGKWTGKQVHQILARPVSTSVKR